LSLDFLMRQRRYGLLEEGQEVMSEDKDKKTPPQISP
jgi:hypothetical protein